MKIIIYYQKTNIAKIYNKNTMIFIGIWFALQVIIKPTLQNIKKKECILI